MQEFVAGIVLPQPVASALYGAAACRDGDTVLRWASEPLWGATESRSHVSGRDGAGITRLLPTEAFLTCREPSGDDL